MNVTAAVPTWRGATVSPTRPLSRIEHELPTVRHCSLTDRERPFT
jgi:hypothetical protein